MGTEKDDVLKHLIEVLGHLPAGARDLLTVLAHPDVIEYTKRYVHSQDHALRCRYYEWPWSCIREAEAKYDSIESGDPSVGGNYHSSGWCESCKERMRDG